MVRPSTDLWRIQTVTNDVETIQADLRRVDVADLQRRLSSVDVVYHLGADGVGQSTKDLESVVNTNVMGTFHMLQLTRLLEAERFVYCGSCFEYGAGTLVSEEKPLTAPVSEYAASKTAGHLLVGAFAQRYGLPVTSLRPFSVYGPFEAPRRLVPHAIIHALDRSEIELTGGRQKRDFVFVGDVVEAFLAAAIARSGVGETFNVCTGVETPVRDVVSTIISLTGEVVTPRFGALTYRDTEIPNLSGDPAKANDVLGWRASRSLEEGLRETIEWFSMHRAEHGVYGSGG